MTTNLLSGRVVCPKCKRKGLGYASHPHAFGHKDYNKASCRYCHARFNIKRRDDIDQRPSGDEQP